MIPDDNPFANDDPGSGSSPFGDAGHVTCCKCGGSIPREEASYKIKTSASGWSVLGSLFLWGPVLGSFLAEDKQHRGYYCALCLRLDHEKERRMKIILFVAVVLIVLLLILLFVLGK